MRTHWVWLFALALIRGAGSAHAADEPLLVVVESTPGAGIDAREVRQTVGAELGIPVVAPEDATAAGASNVLIVSIDKSDIRMSLRGSAAGLVGRTIPAPVDRPTRLREIGWLAGNLARDQVSGIVAAPAEHRAGAHATDLAAADLAPAIETAPQTAPPADLTAVPARSPEPAAIVATDPSASAPPGGSLWSVTAAFGPTADKGALLRNGSGSGGTIFTGNTAFQIEVERVAAQRSRAGVGTGRRNGFQRLRRRGLRRIHLAPPAVLLGDDGGPGTRTGSGTADGGDELFYGRNFFHDDDRKPGVAVLARGGRSGSADHFSCRPDCPVWRPHRFLHQEDGRTTTTYLGT